MMMDIQPPSLSIIKQTGFFVEYIGHVGVYELVVGGQGKKKGVSSWLRQGDDQAKVRFPHVCGMVKA
jgi:hypothetical protein